MCKLMWIWLSFDRYFQPHCHQNRSPNPERQPPQKGPHMTRREPPPPADPTHCRHRQPTSGERNRLPTFHGVLLSCGWRGWGEERRGEERVRRIQAMCTTATDKDGGIHASHMLLRFPIIHFDPYFCKTLAWSYFPHLSASALRHYTLW